MLHITPLNWMKLYFVDDEMNIRAKADESEIIKKAVKDGYETKIIRR